MSEQWTWAYEDATGAPMPEEGLGTTAFPTQSDAESWFGEVWHDLSAAGVAAAVPSAAAAPKPPDIGDAEGPLVAYVTDVRTSEVALLDRSVTLGDDVVVDVRGRDVAATVSKPPFVEVGVREK